MIIRSFFQRASAIKHLSRCMSTTPGISTLVQQTADAPFNVVHHSSKPAQPLTAPHAPITAPAFPMPAPAPATAPAVAAPTPAAVYVLPKADPLLAFLTTLIMRHGKLHRARKHVAAALSHIGAQTHSDPLPLVRSAVLLASPAVRIVSHRKSAKTVMIPFPLGERQRVRRGILWIIDAASKRSERGFHVRLAREMMDIVNGRSPVLTKKAEVHRTAMLNRSNAQVRTSQV